jgi:hypothetical protein
MEADAEQIANEILAQYTSGIQSLGGALLTGPLGDLTSSASADTDGISGSLKLQID